MQEMSDEEEDNFCYFGKPLSPYDEGEFPKKRPISIEDQIATDAKGKRRFHGAFSGGFSAGFFNTVGSLEGWTPTEFKSTRQQKANSFSQKPEDFMDQEDLGEYGIAPQTVKATKDYSTSKISKKQFFSDGPIPGIPVLEDILSSGNETIGYLLLKKIGIRDKIKKHEEIACNVKVYGCEKPNEFRIPEKIENKQYKISEMYINSLLKPKSNTFGLGYTGLNRNQKNIHTNSQFIITDKDNKKLSIMGQAFGVGALEEDDDDIYMKDDMSNYDFELQNEEKAKTTSNTHLLYFDLFKTTKTPLVLKTTYTLPMIPHSFTGKHKVRKSRFEIIESQTDKKEEIDRKVINPAIRAKYLGEETVATTSSQPTTENNLVDTQMKSTSSFSMSSLMDDKFVSASQNEDVIPAKSGINNLTEHGTKDMREAARMNMFGPLTRITTEWTGCSVLYKRFNVPEPSSKYTEEKSKKRTKNLIFENQKHSDDDFIKFECLPKLNPEGSSSSPPIVIEIENEQENNLKAEIVCLDQNVEKKS